MVSSGTGDLFLLDSSACIPILRKQGSLADLPSPDTVVISTIVAAELLTGVQKVTATHPQHAARLESFLAIFQMAEFTEDAARHYAEIRADLERRGKTIGPMDLLIAAHARSLGATLVTRNAKEFRRVKGLQILALK